MQKTLFAAVLTLVLGVGSQALAAERAPVQPSSQVKGAVAEPVSLAAPQPDTIYCGDFLCEPCSTPGAKLKCVWQPGEPDILVCSSTTLTWGGC